MFPRCCPTLNNTLKGERSIPAENRWPLADFAPAGKFCRPGSHCRAAVGTRPKRPPASSDIFVKIQLVTVTAPLAQV